jgi:DHA3 family macrolide efflux protein-like MFS transporter
MSVNVNWKKNAVLFLISQNISLFGSLLVQYAITWYITLESESGIMVTLSIVSGFLPTLFLSPFAGVWADRYNRKLLIALSDSLIAISTLGLVILFMLGYNSIWLLFIVSAIRSLGSGIQTPAISAFLPEFIPEDKLIKVNGINSSIQSLEALIAPILSGALLTVASMESIFFIDVVTAATAVSILLLFLRIPYHAKTEERKGVSYFQDMMKGIKYINQHSFIKTLFIFSAFFFISAAPLAFLTPLQVARSFGDDVWRLSMIEITFSIGMMLGGILVASWGGYKNKHYTMVVSCFFMSGCTIALGLIPDFWIYSFIMGVVGLVMPMFNTPFTVLLQQRVDADYMGRVFGVLSMISSSMMPLAMLLFGPMSDYIRIEWLLVGTGILMLIITIIMTGNKNLIEAGKLVE